MTEQTTPPAAPLPAPHRPQMPDGYGLPATEEGMVSWSQVNGWLERALLYWIGTTRPDGRPHASPIWGAWVDNCFYMEGSPETRRGKNLAANPAVNVHIEQEEAIVIVEGRAEVVAHVEPALAARLVEAFAAKYQPRFNYTPDPAGWEGGGLYRVRPQVVLAWHHFPQDAARWQFGG